MIKLIVPNEEYLPSYKEAYDEYVDKGISTYSFTDASSCDVFAKFDRYRNERNLPPDRVDADIFWLVDDERTYFIDLPHFAAFCRILLYFDQVMTL